ncbi:hypothetical protein HPK19_25040 (plasmid) [Arthrobacter citreus]|nr:hypothetical protein HPK19_25040 [Arthrobacter citreus]
MNKERLYELSKDVNLEYEQGIAIEIVDFFEDEDKVVDTYTKDYKENIYYVNVKMKNFDFQNARKLFSSLVNFIEYSNATFYVCERNFESVQYTLLSKMNSSKGFLIEVNIY